MKLKIRSKGERLVVCDEHGNEIEGVTSVEMKRWDAGDGAPLFRVEVVAPMHAQIEGESQLSGGNQVTLTRKELLARTNIGESPAYGVTFGATGEDEGL